VTLRVRLDGEGTDALLTDVSYQPQGCSISMASASVMAERVTGRSVAQALAAYDSFHTLVTNRNASPPAAVDDEDDSAAFAGVAKFPARVKCALLGWTALREALVRSTAL